MIRVPYLLVLLLLSCIAIPVHAVSPKQIEDNILGEHGLTLQWLDNQNKGNRGSAKIFKKDDTLRIEGYQHETNDGQLNYLKINGTIKVISLRELEFKGTITTKVNYINDGLEYERTGTYLFKAWGKRRYWRMQTNRTQPDGDHDVTDYIDIHFKH